MNFVAIKGAAEKWYSKIINEKWFRIEKASLYGKISIVVEL